MLKKLLISLLCAALLLSSACTAAQPAADTPSQGESTQDVPAQDLYVPSAPEASEETLDEPAYLSQNSAEYRALYTDNPIEAAFEERFANAMSAEDFEALSIDYRNAWEEEYHALMDTLISLYADDAEELKGLRDYTDDAAQTAYTEAYSQHIYVDEEGREQVGMAGVQSGHFAAAELYREATVLSILNDYRETETYAFHYTTQP